VGLGIATVESMDLTPKFWQKRRVFITGHTGFKGSWLALWLRRLGADVTGFSLPPPPGPNLFDLARVDSHVSSVFADVRDLAQVKRAMEHSRAEIVFHLAAQSLVRESYRSPLETISTNVLGTANVLEGVRTSGDVRAVVVVTSDKCYENRELKIPYRESDAVGGHDPYSASKGAAELVTASYRRSFFANAEKPAIASARAGNVIGGGDFAADRLLPDCVRAAAARRPVSIRNPESIRPWQFVLDPLTGYLDLAQRLIECGHSFAEPWNFGPAEDEAYTVRSLCERFVAALNRERHPLTIEFEQQANQPHEAAYLRLDASKAQQRLGWSPTLSYTEAIATTASWYANYLQGNDMHAVTISQIDGFTALMHRSRR
jgi:CDP-glucose 4,6-dehydratase